MSETGVVDPISFTKAEHYFDRLDTSGWICPEEVKSISVERPFKNDRGPWRGITILFGGKSEGRLCQLQFIRPTMWRVRFDPTITNKSDYTDWNTITIVGDHCSTLIALLDTHEGIQWKTTLEDVTEPPEQPTLLAQQGPLEPFEPYWEFKSIVTAVDAAPAKVEHTAGVVEAAATKVEAAAAKVNDAEAKADAKSAKEAAAEAKKDAATATAAYEEAKNNTIAAKDAHATAAAKAERAAKKKASAASNGAAARDDDADKIAAESKNKYTTAEAQVNDIATQVNEIATRVREAAAKVSAAAAKVKAAAAKGEDAAAKEAAAAAKGEATAAMVEAAAAQRGNYVSGQVTSLYIYKHPFRIQAARVLKPASDLYPLPNVITTQAASSVKTVWQTSAKTFRYKAQGEHSVLKPVILDVVKAGHGEFVGWGEQGGSSFMKKPSYMNYFNSDNMQYQQVYNQGPKDPREPLYHSDPFWLDVNSSPAHMNVTATFVDNPSQISVDFGKNNAGFIKVGTKFGMMDVYIISGDTLRDIVRLYTTIIGRGELKPRYVLGNHQACYGYMNRGDLENVVNQYRGAKIPLDGLHIDVPLQKNFRTFTVNEDTFPQPRAMFQWLKGKGIKCSTNITPVISANDLADSYDVPKEQIYGGELPNEEPPNPPKKGYRTLRSAKENDYLLKDYRYTKNAPTDILQTKYMCYKGGDRAVIDPINHYARPDFTGDSGPHDRYKDSYDLNDTYNTGKYYHGGVSYGYSDGTPGHYANLNNPVIQKWWGTQYKDLFDLGLEFVWQDMTTPAIGENYGDMKGLPSRLLLPFKDGNLGATDREGKVVIGENGKPSKFKLAIEAWAIYSYNLHRATYRGLARLKGREDKRNFILGRGSYVGMYRFAGLWTGDNASTWDFWRITVPQVLSIGLNGVSICGADTGGFEPSKDASGKEEKICNPELIIRWYVGSTFLPWLRNHYVSRQEVTMENGIPVYGEKRKWFQEPYAYPKHWDEKHEEQNLSGQAWLYYGVKHITRYYIQLRYSLMQLLYDTMFENQFHGLPIARSMILTDPQDTTFFNETQGFLDNQYVVGQDILVAPIMHGRQEPDVAWAEPAQRCTWNDCPGRGYSKCRNPECPSLGCREPGCLDLYDEHRCPELGNARACTDPIHQHRCPGLRHARGWGRDVYFPLRYSWFQSNLAPFPHQRTALGDHVYGGTVRHEMARIPEWDDHQLESEKEKSERAAYPDVLLHYIREGAIIPQVEVKDFIDTGTDRELNPITLHVYPHIWRGKNKKTEYTTYLDDGVSCSSAPKDILRAKQMQINTKRRLERGQAQDGDGAAGAARAGAHWGLDKYREVKITHETTSNTVVGKIVTRKITISRGHDKFPPKEYIGESYTVILWYEKEPFTSSLTHTSTPDALNGQITFVKDDTLRAFVVTVKETLGDTEKIELTFTEEKE